jgi:undecaprenyl-phosphate galactose phosphotransferase
MPQLPFYGKNMKPTEPFFIAKTKWYCKKETEKWLLLGIDALALTLAFYLAAVVVTGTAHLMSSPVPHRWSLGEHVGVKSALVLYVITLSAFWAKGHYSKRRPYANEVREVLIIMAMLALVDVALVFFGGLDLSRSEIVTTWLMAPCLLLLCRAALKKLLGAMGGWQRPMVIIGYGDNALQTARAFDDERMMGYTLTAFVVPDDRERKLDSYVGSNGRLIPCITLGSVPERTLAHLGNPHIVLALEAGGIDTYQDIIQRLGRHSRNIQIVPSLRGLPLYGMEVNHFFAHEVLLLTVRNNLARRFPQLVKRMFDLVVSLTVLLVGLPVLLWIALRVSASGRPVFYGHTRVGRHNKPFPCYKFRTMEINADQLLADLLARDPEARAEWQKDFKLKNDPRVTPIGQFLRKTSLDELPQLWNVIKGEMSLVGPRPVVDAELARYGNQVEYYLEANPGITGLWQISGRNDISYDERVYLDAWYVKNWSLFSDIVILFKTVKVIFKKDGAY